MPAIAPELAGKIGRLHPGRFVSLGSNRLGSTQVGTGGTSVSFRFVLAQREKDDVLQYLCTS